jgi:hypothetical protein
MEMNEEVVSYATRMINSILTDGTAQSGTANTTKNPAGYK